jgi:hypothetical protein
MAYVGTPIDTRNTFQSLQGKRFNGDGSTTDFTLDVAPSSTLDIEVFVGNVRQDPNSAYTLSGTTLTFTGAPPSGTNNIYVVHQAKSVGTINPGANSVGVTELNLSDGSSGQFIKTDGSGTLSFATISTGVALDDVSTGDAASTLATSAGNITVDAQGNDTDIIFKGTDGGADTTFLTLDGSEGGQLVLGTHGQINFPDSANVSTDANVLDDYQEGTFNLSSSQASNFLTGFYTKIGRMVWFTCAGVIPTSGNSATQTLTGLPFTVKDQTAGLGGDAEGSDAQIGIVGHHSDTGAIAVKFVLANNSTNANLFQSDNSVATHATFSGDTFNLAGFYTTDS